MSIKSRLCFAPGDAQALCSEMAKRAENGKVSVGLCLLVVFGSTTESSDGPLALSEAKCVEVANGKLVQAVVRIPLRDAFGTSEALRKLTGTKGIWEVHASHSFLRALPESSLTPEDALRRASSGNAPAIEALKELSYQLKQH